MCADKMKESRTFLIAQKTSGYLFASSWRQDAVDLNYDLKALQEQSPYFFRVVTMHCVIWYRLLALKLPVAGTL